MLYDESSDTESLIKDFSKDAFVWYNFRPGSSILYVYNQNADEAVQRTVMLLSICVEIDPIH